MATVGVFLALPGLIKLCVETGGLILEKIKTFRNAATLKEIQALCISLTEGQIFELLMFFESLKDSLSTEFVGFLTEITTKIVDQLSKAKQMLSSDDFDNSIYSRAAYASKREKRLKEVVNELETWTNRLTTRSMSYMMIQLYWRGHLASSDSSADSTQSPASSADRLLRLMKHRPQSAVSLLQNDMHYSQFERLDQSNLWWSSAQDFEPKIVEYRSYRGKDFASIEHLRKIVRDVAKELNQVDSKTMRILQCTGFSDDRFEQRFCLHFAVADRARNPRTLRSLISDPINQIHGKKHSLSDRVALARSIAVAVLYVHACGFVHKNIRPENILVFEEVDDRDGVPAEQQQFPYKIGPAYLCGYDGIRPEESHSLPIDTSDWRKTIYTPAERLRPITERPKFSWRHDIYSLGVILLEIALWDDLTNRDGRYGKMLRKSNDHLATLEQIAKQVPRLIGDRYFDATTACLKMLADESFDPRDEDGVILGTAYMSEVLDRLEKIVM